MSSAWKNAVPRREHRERPQPAARKHLGLLEKHKDYVKRARSHHRKRDRMTALKRRAELRNQDEFYYGMSGAKTKVSAVEARAPDAPGNAQPCPSQARPARHGSLAIAILYVTCYYRRTACT